MIERWKWDGGEISAKAGTPEWIVEAYERGKILAIADRKTGEKTIIVHTKYGDMRGHTGCFIIRINFQQFLVLDHEDYAILKISQVIAC